MDLRAEYCPSSLLVDGCPVELSQGALEYFEENASRYVAMLSLISRILMLVPFIKFPRNINSAISFNQLHPFANVSAITVSDVSVDNYRHDVLWDGSNKPVVFSMLASVHASNIIQPLQLKNYKMKSLTVIPFGNSWHKFEDLLGRLYGAGEMQGPFEYGCLLKLTTRRERGFSGQFILSSSVISDTMMTIAAASSAPSALAATPRKNLKAFGSSRPTPSTLWFERKQPSCLNFTDDGMCFFVFSYAPLIFFT